MVVTIYFLIFVEKLNMIPRRYIVKIPFKNLGKTYFTGEVIPHNKLRNIPREVIEKNVYIQDYNDIQLAITYGLIFLSKEFPFQQYFEEETRDEIIERLKCEMKKCCCGSKEPFLKGGECNYCKECYGE